MKQAAITTTPDTQKDRRRVFSLTGKSPAALLVQAADLSNETKTMGARATLQMVDDLRDKLGGQWTRETKATFIEKWKGN